MSSVAVALVVGTIVLNAPALVLLMSTPAVRVDEKREEKEGI